MMVSLSGPANCRSSCMRGSLSHSFDGCTGAGCCCAGGGCDVGCGGCWANASSGRSVAAAIAHGIKRTKDLGRLVNNLSKLRQLEFECQSGAADMLITAAAGVAAVQDHRDCRVQAMCYRNSNTSLALKKSGVHRDRGLARRRRGHRGGQRGIGGDTAPRLAPQLVEMSIEAGG